PISLRMPVRPIWRRIFHIASRSRARDRGSQVVPRIAEVERLVDQREVGNDVADHRMLEHGPVLPGGIVAMAAADAVAICIAVELERDEDFAAPAFDPAGAESRAGGQADGAAMLAWRQRGEEVPDQAQRFEQLD